jgi:A/G-specific adenine glycosylase
VAYNDASVSKFPEKKEKKIKQQDLYLCVITNQENEVVLVQRAAKGIWGGLWCFPERTDGTGVNTLLESLGIGKAKKIEQLTPFNHKLSHINFKIFPILVSVTNQKKVSSSFIWQSLTEDWCVGVPKSVTKIIDILVGCKPKLLQ